MKLNYRKTIFVGFAFFLICAFWQAYDSAIPILLIRKFGMSQTVSGVIMALDNVLALFMLPLFGAISDRTKHPLGRRTPYILFGTIVSICAFVLLPRIGALPVFIGLLLVTLIAMATFRSPAVALMPDVTIKPLRSKANAVINLMGSAGGILVLALGIVFGTGKTTDYTGTFSRYFLAVAGLMAVALLIFMLTVREPRFVKEMQEESKRFGLTDEEEMPDAAKAAKAAAENAGDGPASVYVRKPLDKAKRRSLILILASIVLWFTGYNAVTSKYSVYAGMILNKDFNLTLIIAQAAAIIAYLPVGIVASKIGRKKTILAGVVMLTAAFGTAAFLRAGAPTLLMNAMFALAGIAWATINVNSFPMVVEMCSGEDVGRYTGYYYTASMAAQVITPVFSGFLMDKFGMTVLFPYAVVFVAAAFFTMLGVMHGDSKPEAKRGLEALEDLDN